jgi:phage terminase large subunit-like protein
VSSLYEQGRVSHVGSLAALEDQMTAWDPAGDGESPDRVDALVYALSELTSGTQPASYAASASAARGALRPSW